MLTEKPRFPVREMVLFGLFPSFIKVWLYRLRGYRIGKRVRIGFGSVICADRVAVGNDTRIGFLTIIRGKEIVLGSRVQIGSTSFLDTPYIEIGDGTRINEQVFIGGLQFPDSRIVIGRNCQIMQMSFINPARTITIGDDTGIGGHSLIFGHTSWLSQFEGYPVDFQDVEIGRSVSLAWRVFVLPGTTIGDGAVVGANSLVSGKVPPRCLTLGFPARVVSKAPDFPRELDNEEKRRILENIIENMIGYYNQSGLQCVRDGDDIQVIQETKKVWFRKKHIWRMRIVYGVPAADDVPSSDQTLHLFLSLGEINEELRARLNSMNIMWIEIARKEQSFFSNQLGDEVSHFLKRYGVRTLRAPS